MSEPDDPCHAAMPSDAAGNCVLSNLVMTAWPADRCLYNGVQTLYTRRRLPSGWLVGTNCWSINFTLPSVLEKVNLHLRSPLSGVFETIVFARPLWAFGHF
jgi:hypothetical protein